MPKELYSTILEAKETPIQLSSIKENADDVSNVIKSLNTPDIGNKIRLAANRYGVDESIALNIACAESNLDPKAKNKKSTAGGVYQWLNGSWKYYGLKYWKTLEGRDKLNADDNIELAMLVLRDFDTEDWSASEFEGYGGGWKNKPYEKGLCKKKA